MGCVSSKIARKELKRERQFEISSTHVVSLTSSTYGLLQLDDGAADQPPPEPPQCIKKCVSVEMKKSPSPPQKGDQAEVINAWELMEDLDETEAPCSIKSRKSPKSRVFLDYRRSPLKLFNQKSVLSPRRFRIFGGAGKENNGVPAASPGKLSGKITVPSPKTTMPQKMYNKLYDNERISHKGNSPDSSPIPPRAALTPTPPAVRSLFAAAGLSTEEAEQWKQKSSVSTKASIEVDKVIQKFPKICPPGGGDAVVVYTTTLRGIRKTFEDCNTARSILQSHQVRTLERDVSMHSGFKEELRSLMGTTEVKVPLVFVKGRLIGGADEISRLEEEGTLGTLLAGIPRAATGGCGGCGGVRFLCCWECSGSCKVLGDDGKSSVKCGECNENGLIQCPICC
ncbi:unnamed protein product [Cuscuta epithymum]|uniref:Glutaredoxin domain-containing protein n=1 Tax=Cuscuta epithymum TaxID=186058 RepID=A0AAV0CVY8_9ASTE|nr:unnamed protein product [Cuscuta epithymum]